MLATKRRCAFRKMEVRMATKDARKSWSDDLKKVRRILLRALGKSKQLREPLTEALELLENLDDQVQRLADASQPSRRQVINSSVRYQPKRYTIEKRRRGEYLCEYRVGGRAQPFCCPREDYDVAAKTLAELNDWTQFDDVKSLVNEQTGQTQPDYLIRLCLRFWQAADPPIVEKDRTFYRPCVRGSFQNAAKRVWRELEAKRGE
jgi:hypothetical protein